MPSEVNKRLGIQMGQEIFIGTPAEFGVKNAANPIVLCIESQRFNTIAMLSNETATKIAQDLLEAADCTVKIMAEDEIPFDLAERFEIKHNVQEKQWYLVLYGKNQEMALKCSLRDIHKLKEQLEAIL